MARIVEVTAYNPDWPAQFAAEAILIRQALGANCVVVHHIGSTFVPGLVAKPILDILPVVKDITAVNTPGLEALGYAARGEMGMPFRRYFNKGRPIDTHHVHIWEQGNPEIEKHRLFREYLITHPAARNAYAEIKQQLAQQFKDDRRQYTASKDEFIKNIVAKSGFTGLTIVHALHANEWREYHRIKKTQIFDRLPNITYDPKHPHLTDPKHYHYILFKGVDAVAIAHIQMLDAETAAMRTLATDQGYQKQGYGAYLLAQMERWLKQQGRTKILMHAATRAEHFYRKLGYVDMVFDDVGINEDHVDLGKILSSSHVSARGTNEHQ